MRDALESGAHMGGGAVQRENCINCVVSHAKYSETQKYPSHQNVGCTFSLDSDPSLGWKGVGKGAGVEEDNNEIGYFCLAGHECSRSVRGGVGRKVRSTLYASEDIICGLGHISRGVGINVSRPWTSRGSKNGASGGSSSKRSSQMKAHDCVGYDVTLCGLATFVVQGSLSSLRTIGHIMQNRSL